MLDVDLRNFKTMVDIGACPIEGVLDGGTGPVKVALCGGYRHVGTMLDVSARPNNGGTRCFGVVLDGITHEVEDVEDGINWDFLGVRVGDGLVVHGRGVLVKGMVGEKVILASIMVVFQNRANGV